MSIVWIMARKTGLEYPGVCYHVINRGNCRRWVFEEDGVKDAFERRLAERVTRRSRGGAGAVMAQPAGRAAPAPASIGTQRPAFVGGVDGGGGGANAGGDRRERHLADRRARSRIGGVPEQAGRPHPRREHRPPLCQERQFGCHVRTDPVDRIPADARFPRI
jgi:hypothetical protein